MMRGSVGATLVGLLAASRRGGSPAWVADEVFVHLVDLLLQGDLLGAVVPVQLGDELLGRFAPE